MEYSDNLMQEAFNEARGALDKGEVPVGAIFYDTQTQKIIARDCNSVNATKNATRHAEFNCIDQVLAKNTKKLVKLPMGKYRGLCQCRAMHNVRRSTC